MRSMITVVLRDGRRIEGPPSSFAIWSFGIEHAEPEGVNRIYPWASVEQVFGPSQAVYELNTTRRFG